MEPSRPAPPLVPPGSLAPGQAVLVAADPHPAGSVRPAPFAAVRWRLVPATGPQRRPHADA